MGRGGSDKQSIGNSNRSTLRESNQHGRMPAQLRLRMPESDRLRMSFRWAFSGLIRLLEGFGETELVVEGCADFLCDGLGCFFEVVGDFDDAGGLLREGGDVLRYVGPVDDAGAGPEV